ncbi:MAG: DUF4411 family protein [Bacteroidetes bacterium]|nr:DUF4411 family protein [Bacteroidota bacterium]
MDLFNEEKRVYVIDTNALITLDLTFKREVPVFTGIWEEIEDLIRSGNFKIIDFVEQEINDYEGKEEFLKTWVKKWKKHLVAKTDTESINASIPIINEEYNTGFLTASKQAQGKEEADPYLIGFCKLHKYVLISNESKAKPNKMPAVARKNGVECISLNDFMVERELKIQRKS